MFPSKQKHNQSQARLGIIYDSVSVKNKRDLVICLLLESLLYNIVCQFDDFVMK
jgi:hypothetical protein